ncbi:SMI1/KNR4 family protein [Plantactinospora endophytica]|uniref:SMI1/KNR4 family protein n=1 Tax=Plantactinospora endophytica TaxID=673535 RepID=A0ABQ4DRT9_9ACTN|nr:SMI1/KNR4 family protein [Plantactinospora endophytica]GIG85169.1 SMI1/KNR4 family protein [Plantactinospora endophytica]
MTDHAATLAAIAARARRDDPDLPVVDDLPAPLSQAAIERAEERLGFRLHPLLAALYRDFANGGFGPEYQLLSLTDGPTSEQAVDCYLKARAEGAGTEWAWPEGVLPILTWGCGMYACVDCRSDAGTVLLFEPNPGDPDEAWFVDTPSLAEWLEHYVDDTGWWVKAENGEDFEMAPWKEARRRAAD